MEFCQGDLVVSRLKPFSVLTVQRGYRQQCDVRQPAGGLVCGVPARVLEKVPADVQLYAVGEIAFDVVWPKAVVVGPDGIVRWAAEQSDYTLDHAFVCDVQHDGGHSWKWGEWFPLAEVLAPVDGQAEAEPALA